MHHPLSKTNRITTKIILGENQPEYENLPVIRTSDGYALMRVEFSDEEIEQIKESKSVYIFQLQGNNLFQPIAVQVEKPEIVYPKQN